MSLNIISGSSEANGSTAERAESTISKAIGSKTPVIALAAIVLSVVTLVVVAVFFIRKRKQENFVKLQQQDDNGGL
jgi:hypothetical protein